MGGVEDADRVHDARPSVLYAPTGPLGPSVASFGLKGGSQKKALERLRHCLPLGLGRSSAQFYRTSIFDDGSGWMRLTASVVSASDRFTSYRTYFKNLVGQR